MKTKTKNTLIREFQTGLSFHDFLKEQIIRTIVLENVQTCLIDVAEKVLLLLFCCEGIDLI